MLMAISSFERSSLRTLVPPEALSTTDRGRFAGTLVRRMPRVHIRASAYGTSSGRSTSGRSRPRVGPWKYPWSTASITVRPSASNIRESRWRIPQSYPSDPRTPISPLHEKGTSGLKSCVCGVSTSGSLPPFAASFEGSLFEPFPQPALQEDGCHVDGDQTCEGRSRHLSELDLPIPLKQ